MSDTDFEFNMDFALMDQQIQKFKEENKRILNEWYQDYELLQAQLTDLHNINKELEEELLKAKEVFKYIEEQSRHSSMMVVGAQLREAVCNCLNGICEKLNKTI